MLGAARRDLAEEYEAAFSCARVSFSSPAMPGLLCRPGNVRHVCSQRRCSGRASHAASLWLDLAEGRLRLDRLSRKGVRIVPEANRVNDNAPSHRVFVGRAEIGAAWSKRSNEGRDYLSLKLDDPSFTAPIYANLFEDEDGEGYSLIWSRGRRANGE